MALFKKFGFFSSVALEYRLKKLSSLKQGVKPSTEMKIVYEEYGCPEGIFPKASPFSEFHNWEAFERFTPGSQLKYIRCFSGEFVEATFEMFPDGSWRVIQFYEVSSGHDEKWSRWDDIKKEREQKEQQRLFDAGDTRMSQLGCLKSLLIK